MHEDVPKLIGWYREGKLKLDELISRRIDLEDVNDAFRAMEAGEVARSVIRVRPDPRWPSQLPADTPPAPATAAGLYHEQRPTRAQRGERAQRLGRTPGRPARCLAVRSHGARFATTGSVSSTLWTSSASIADRDEP